MDPYVQYFLGQMNNNPFQSGNILPGGMNSGEWVNYFLSRNPYSYQEMRDPKLRNGKVGGVYATGRNNTSGAKTGSGTATSGASANGIKTSTTIAEPGSWAPTTVPGTKTSDELNASLPGLQDWYNSWANPTTTPKKVSTAIQTADTKLRQLREFPYKTAEYAKQFVGTPYLWGGNAESTRGYDCAGFVQKVVQDMTGQAFPGPGFLDAQYESGSHPSLKELQPGDLVFFSGTYDNPYTKYGLTHVGIYIGNNQFVHAASENLGTRIDTLDDPYWKPKIYHTTRPDSYQEAAVGDSGAGAAISPEEAQYLQAGANPEPGYQAPTPEPFIPYMEELPYAPYIPEEPILDPNDVPVGGW